MAALNEPYCRGVIPGMSGIEGGGGWGDGAAGGDACPPIMAMFRQHGHPPALCPCGDVLGSGVAAAVAALLIAPHIIRVDALTAEPVVCPAPHI